MISGRLTDFTEISGNYSRRIVTKYLNSQEFCARWAPKQFTDVNEATVSTTRIVTDDEIWVPCVDEYTLFF